MSIFTYQQTRVCQCAWVSVRGCVCAWVGVCVGVSVLVSKLGILMEKKCESARFLEQQKMREILSSLFEEGI